MKQFQSILVVLLASAAFVCPAQNKKLNQQLAHLPPLVQRAVRARLVGAELESIEKSNDEDGVSFDVEISRGGKDRSFSIGAKGELLEEQVFMEELPFAVQQTIRQQAANGPVDEIDRSVEDGQWSYSVQMVRAGKSRTFTVGASGKLIEVEVFLAELPMPVQKTILRQTAGGTVSDIERSNNNGEISFGVEGTRGGRVVNFTVNARGALATLEQSFEELPTVLQNAIQKRAGSAQIGDINKCFDSDGINYDVELTEDGRMTTVSFGPNGAVLSASEDIRLPDAPEAVRGAIKVFAAGGRLTDLSKTTEDGEVSYDAVVETAAMEKSASFSAEGKLIPDDGK